MIIRKRILLACAILCFMTHVSLKGLLGGWSLGRETASIYDVEEITRYRTFTISDENWLEFQFAAKSQAVRLFTNAALAENVRSLPVPIDEHTRAGYRYGIEYELLDRQGDSLVKSEYYFRAPPLNPLNTVESLESFFDKTDFVPAGTRTMQLPLKPYLDAHPARFRIRLIESDPLVREIVVRAYVKQERPGYEKPATWPRLSVKSQEKLIRASVYPSELLTAREKADLLRWKWIAAAPLGLEGRDFKMRRMYVPEEESQELPVDEADGVDAGIGHRIVVPLPNEPGRVRLELSADSHDAKCWIRSFGRAATEQYENQYRVDASPIRLPKFQNGGLIEIASRTPVVAQVYWTATNGSSNGKNEPIDITPQPSPARMFFLKNEPLEFAVSHTGQHATPIRITLRISDSSEEEQSAITDRKPVRWTFEDDKGQVLHRGDFVLQLPVSNYDRLSKNSEYFPVSDSAKYYFWVPPGAKRLRLESDANGVLASVATRAPDHAKLTVVPEDYDLFHRQTLTRKTWFSVRPLDYERLVLADLSITCQFQPRPPTDDEVDLGWDTFFPSDLVAGREILTERNSTKHIRPSSWASVYSEVHGAGFRGQWLIPPGKRQVQPRVVYQILEQTSEGRERQALPEVRVFVDGRLLMRKRLQAQTGEFRLPKISRDELQKLGKRTGRSMQSFEFQCDARARLFVNYFDRPGAKRFVKRTGYEIQPTMEFAISKYSEQEDLMLRVIQSQESAASDPLTMRVRICEAESDECIRIADGAQPDEIRPTASQTVVDRVFRFSRPESFGSVVLGTKDRDYDGGLLAFTPLGEDLPNGNYKMRIEARGDGYVMLHRKQKSGQAKRSLAKEAMDE